MLSIVSKHSRRSLLDTRQNGPKTKKLEVDICTGNTATFVERAAGHTKPLVSGAPSDPGNASTFLRRIRDTGTRLSEMILDIGVQ